MDIQGPWAFTSYMFYPRDMRGAEPLHSSLNPVLVQGLRRASQFCAVIVLSLGLLNYASWFVGVPWLVSFRGIPAIAFCLSGASLLLLTRFFHGKKAFVTARLLAVALCALALWDFATSLSTPQSSEFSMEGRGLDYSLLGSMPPNDAFAFLLAGLSLTFLRARSVWSLRLCEFFAFSCVLTAIMTLFGLIFSVPYFCLFVSCLRISLLGGIGYALLALGLLLGTADRGILSSLSSTFAGGITARRLLPAVVGIPLALGWLRVLGQQYGVFNSETGLTVMIVAMMLLFLLIILWNSITLDRIDKERQIAAARLAESEQRTRLIVQQSIDAFAAVDQDGIIKDWNAQAERIFGWTRLEAMGKSVSDLLVPQAKKETASELFAGLLRSQDEPVPQKPIEVVALKRNGEEIPIELSVFLVRMENESLLCGFARDITERKELEQRFREFYSVVSHEIRAPLASIRGALNVFERSAQDRLSGREVELVQKADGNCDRLMRLISDMLDVKRIEEGKLALSLSSTDVLDVVSLAVDGLSATAQQAGVEVMVVMNADGYVLIDVDRILQVLTNLLSNALKYSVRGQTVKLEIDRHSRERMRISVVDQGPGIPAEDLPKLFTKFERLITSTGAKAKGIGLGLVISKAIVEQHGGSIGVESTLNQGSRFWVELPATDTPPIRRSEMTCNVLEQPNQLPQS